VNEKRGYNTDRAHSVLIGLSQRGFNFVRCSLVRACEERATLITPNTADVCALPPRLCLKASYNYF